MNLLLLESRFVVIDKPSGISVHKGWDASEDTVMRRARDHLSRWVYPVHRLDRGTSGALLMALDSETAGALAASFRDSLVEKEYVALVRGTIAEPGSIDHAIPNSEGGERVEARSDYAPIAIARDRYTLVRVWPRTGRLHQIRRHMKHLNHPLIGDTTYGDGRENRKMREEVALHRLALHARVLSFPHPETGARVEVVAPLAEDLRGSLERLGFAPEVLDGLLARR